MPMLITLLFVLLIMLIIICRYYLHYVIATSRCRASLDAAFCYIYFFATFAMLITPDAARRLLFTRR